MSSTMTTPFTPRHPWQHYSGPISPPPPPLCFTTHQLCPPSTTVLRMFPHSLNQVTVPMQQITLPMLRMSSSLTEQLTTKHHCPLNSGPISPHPPPFCFTTTLTCHPVIATDEHPTSSPTFDPMTSQAGSYPEQMSLQFSTQAGRPMSISVIQDATIQHLHCQCGKLLTTPAMWNAIHHPRYQVHHPIPPPPPPTSYGYPPPTPPMLPTASTPVPACPSTP